MQYRLVQIRGAIVDDKLIRRLDCKKIATVMGVRYAAREQVDAGIFLLLEFIHVLGRNDTIPV